MLRVLVSLSLVSFVLVFYAATIQAEVPTLTFQDLASLPDHLPQGAAILHLQNALTPYLNQEVRIRGFLYQTHGGSWILSPEPNLKSCCVNHVDKVSQQIAINKLTESPTPSAVLLQGRFKVDPQWDVQGKLVRLYSLENAHFIPNTISWSLIVLAGIGISGIAIFALMLFTSKKRKRDKAKEGTTNSENSFSVISTAAHSFKP